ncbi:MAG: TraR/DksA C4-type zinc finger protein [Caldilineales bacterium]|nr:TraR/DksA C4-type zinc finger protein [Caldilineales bacterium]MCW5861361.1 TraR/DksA C4-type zinc finger protein [Caldilineales bacterium]
MSTNPPLTRDRLITELAMAEADLAEVNGQLSEKPDLGPGTGSTGAMNWEMALARKEYIEAQIKSLQQALERAQSGAYGLCQNCGKEIEPERLEILPSATTCADCARKNRFPA